MIKKRLFLAIAFTSAALLVLVVYLLNQVGGQFLGFAFRNAPGLPVVRTVTQYAAVLAALGLFGVAAIVAIPAALQPAGFIRRLLYVIPVFLLFMTLVCIGSGLLGVGATVGRGSSLSFIAASTFAVGTLTAIAVGIAAARMSLPSGTAGAATTVMGLTAVPSVVAWVGLAASAVIVLTSPTSFGQPGVERNAPNSQGGEGRAFGSRGGEGGPGGFGGPALGTLFGAGAGLATIFTAAELAGVIGGLRANRRITAEPAPAPVESAAPPAHGRQVGPAVVSFVVVGAVVLGAMQLVQVPHDNPPVQTTVAWDSPQTEQLWNRACADCHSNDTHWTWYSYMAPVSWLTVQHILDGRRQINISQPGRGEGPNQAAEQIRNGQMPLADYILLHPEARLTDAEKQQLEQGILATLGGR